jgi:hypothetical protein
MKYETVRQMKILLEDIRLASGINQLEAERALGTVLGFLSSRLPSPVIGRIYGALSEDTESKRLGNAAI